MNSITLQKLEFVKILQELEEMAYSEGGRNLVKSLVPETDIDMVRKYLNETEEAMELLRFEDPWFLHDLKIVDKQLYKAKAAGILMSAELLDIYYLLRASRLAKKYSEYSQISILLERLMLIEPNRELENDLQRSVDEEGFIKDDASPALKSIRKQIEGLRMKIKDYLQEFVRSASKQSVLQDAIITERSGRYVVPVKQEHRQDVKGIVHDESSSGATVFIEPMAVVEQNNKIRSLENEEKREIERILYELTSKVALYKDSLSQNSRILSELDFIFARARLAYKMDAYKPELNEQGRIELYKARHPLLGDKAVPINIELGKRFDLLIITGPNTGGKTVVLKTIGLLTLMAMSGLFIPAQEKSQISIFNKIFVDIGDEQSIEQSLSTFSSHMQNIISILRDINEKSLVLLDELGAGTDPVEGAALARAILENIKRVGARAVVTTHQSELKSFAYQNKRVENACVEFDSVTLMPTYELTIGTPGHSNAFAISQRLGLNESIVKRARELVPKQEMEIGDMIRQLKEKQYLYSKEIDELEKQKKFLQEQKDDLEIAKEKMLEERDAILFKAQKEADLYIRNIKKQANEALEEVKRVLRIKETPPKWHEIDQSRQKLKKLHEKTLWEDTKSRKQEINQGDYVIIKSLNQKGYVLNCPADQDEVQVQVGAMKLSIKKDQLILSAPGEERKPYKSKGVFLEKAKTISAEIDLRGQLAVDAIMDLDKYISDAMLVGLPSIRIIHGKGTGALRNAVREYLQGHIGIKKYRNGMPEEGGLGVTIAELK